MGELSSSIGEGRLGTKITKRLQLDDYMNGTYSGLEAGLGGLFWFGRDGNRDPAVPHAIENSTPTDK